MIILRDRLRQLVNESNPQLEFYDFSTTGGQDETDNTYSTSEEGPEMLAELWDNLLPNELQASVGPYQPAQKRAYDQLQEYMYIVNNPPSSDVSEEAHRQLARAWTL
jgi:hypothetical protein